MLGCYGPGQSKVAAICAAVVYREMPQAAIARLEYRVTMSSGASPVSCDYDLAATPP